MSRDILEVFKYYLENTTDSITASDCDSWLCDISSIQYILKDIQLNHTLQDLAFIQFFLPDVDTISIETESQYNDEGDYYDVYSGVSVSTGNALLDRMIHHWGYAFYDEHGEQYIDLQVTNQEYVASLKHPLLSLFEEYTPKDEQAWNNLWTLFRSPKFEDFNQACTLLEGYIEGDAELQEALRTFVFEYDIIDTLGFGCSNWWMLLYLDPKRIDGENIDGRNFDACLEYTGSDFCISDGAPQEITEPILSKVYDWAHRSISLCKEAYFDSKEEDINALNDTFGIA